MSTCIDLTDKTALVTGSSQGIGAEIVRAFHRSGAKVVINHPGPDSGKTATDARVLCEELTRDRPASALVHVADVSDPTAVLAMMERVRGEWGGLDILVNNAGILRDRSIKKMTLEEWRSVLDVNLNGVFYSCKYGLEIMKDGGAIVCVGSLAASLGFHGQSNYSAAKAGVQALVRVLARECASRSIRVNAVAPGVIDTPMVAQVSDEARNHLERSIAMKRLGRPTRSPARSCFFARPWRAILQVMSWRSMAASRAEARTSWRRSTAMRPTAAILAWGVCARTAGLCR